MKFVRDNIVTDVAFFTILVYGLFFQAEWARNIALFAVAICTLTGLLLYLKEVRTKVKEHWRKEGRLPRDRLGKRWDTVTDTLFILLVVTAGHLFLGTLFFLATCGKHTTSSEYDKECSAT